LYFLLLLPLIKIFTSFSFDNFNYFLFLFPTACFVILYPLSVLESFRKYRKQKNTSQMPSSEQNPEVCDATTADSSNAVD
jgi:hypothetical protein